MLYDLFIGSFKDGDWAGVTLAIISWLLGLVIVAFIGWGLLYLVDSTNLSDKQGEGRIENMYYRPSHYVTTYVKSGDVLVPITTFHDEEFHVCISVKGLIDDVTVRKSYYEDMKIGQTLYVTYSNGRIWDSMYVKNFRLK